MKKIYLCGPTVYDYPHIGNLKPVITLDFLIKSYKILGQKTLYVHNITDIDDKIIKRAQTTKETEQEITKKFTQNYLSILHKLNISMPDHMPKVSDHIGDMINFIQKLINKNVAYESNGSVYFDIESTPRYGMISNQKQEKMQNENSNNDKWNVQDFALWKKTSIGLSWKSPWSNGIPGWHTECVTFIDKYFKSSTLDIHAGGIDLKFPHHENENIEFLALNNKILAKKWIHFGHLFLDEEKMSKSIGNILRADKFLEKYGANVFRLIFILTNPLSPLNLNDKLIKDAIKLNNKLEKIAKININHKNNNCEKFATLIINLEFAKAISLLHNELKKWNKGVMGNIGKLWAMISILGLKYQTIVLTNEQKALLAQWEQMKKEKNYVEADKIREELKKMKII